MAVGNKVGHYHDHSTDLQLAKMGLAKVDHGQLTPGVSKHNLRWNAESSVTISHHAFIAPCDLPDTIEREGYPMKKVAFMAMAAFTASICPNIPR